MAEKPNVRYCLKVYKTMEFEMWCAGIKLNTNSLKRNNLDNARNYLKSSSQLQSILNLLKIQYSQNIEQEDLIETVIDKLEDPRFSTNKKIGFISEQLHLLNSAPKGRRYSSSLLSMCCILYRASPACYKQIINDDILTVPGERNLRLISYALHMDLSLDESTIAYLKARFSKLSEKDKYVALLMDEVHCNQSVHYVNGKFYGIENGEITKTLLCVMVKSVAGNYRDVISMNTIVNINAEKLKKIWQNNVEVSSNIGFDVVVTMTDDHEGNSKFFRSISANESFDNFIKNPLTKQVQFFCYMILFIYSRTFTTTLLIMKYLSVLLLMIS